MMIAALLAAVPLPAQRRARVEVTLPPAEMRGTEPPVVRCVQVLSSGRLRDLLHHGFPARLHFRLELWSTRGWFDDIKARAEWDVILRFSPLDRQYTVIRLIGDRATRLGTFSDFREAVETVERPFRPPLRLPRRRDRYYYNVVLNVEMLSVNDLDEVERWLRGELRPAVRGKRSPGTALARGARTLAVRLLGGEQRVYEARSQTFRPK
jgi:Domain of unknown function (DUF4390)